MQNLFLAILAVLVAFSQYVTYRVAGKDGLRPIYWATVMNPSYRGYADKYLAWRKAQGLPEEKIAIDVNSFGLQKTLVQGVSGVAADVIDTHAEMPYYREVGLIENLDQWPDVAGPVRKNLESFPWVSNAFLGDGHLYCVPTRYHTQFLLLNLDTLKKWGIKAPPFVNSLDEFEKIAREFVEKANAGKTRRDAYFCANIPFNTLFHSSGISIFNETGTGMAKFDAARQALMDRYRRWMYDDHLIPTPAEMASFSVEYVGLGAAFSIFYKGQFAALFGGRYVAIFMRQLPKPAAMGGMLVPHGGYPVVDISYGGLTLYKGGHIKERALGFMKWCTSLDFAKAAVASSDALPPFPQVFDDPELLRPSKWTNEWDFHRRFVEVIRSNHVCSPDETPYLIGSQMNVWNKGLEAWTIRAIDAATAWSNAEAFVAKDISVNLNRRPEWRAKYAKALETQKKIDAIKEAGGKIPLQWVENPYLRQYYKDKGRGE